MTPEAIRDRLDLVEDGERLRGDRSCGGPTEVAGLPQAIALIVLTGVTTRCGS